RERSSMPM
ncbi:pyridine nucleotide-disulfide oxidoreductase family protein, partial [Vibrio parahaemolyticus AQ3810]